MNLEYLYSQLEAGCEPGARALLGYELVCLVDGVRTSGYITETEAYSQDDPASHTFRGQTKRNAAMYGPAGTIYVYFTYGMHYCFNIVTGKVGEGEGVLIRSIEPKDGIEYMQQRRRMVSLRQLTNGPAKLVSALGITPGENGLSIGSGSIHLEPGKQLETEQITTGVRIGITKATQELRRFYISDSDYVSKP